MSPARPALAALIELCCQMRDDWDRTEAEGAILAAGQAGWSWERCATITVQLACDGTSMPRDLTEAARSWRQEQRHPATPDEQAAGAAYVRECMEDTLARMRAAEQAPVTVPPAPDLEGTR